MVSYTLLLPESRIADASMWTIAVSSRPQASGETGPANSKENGSPTTTVSGKAAHDMTAALSVGSPIRQQPVLRIARNREM
jgi:hypothetical protein